MQTFAFNVLEECSSWVPRNGAVQIFFLTLYRNMFAENLYSQKGFWLCLWEHIIFNVK